jgi:hypothetical protein
MQKVRAVPRDRDIVDHYLIAHPTAAHRNDYRQDAQAAKANVLLALLKLVGPPAPVADGYGHFGPSPVR